MTTKVGVLRTCLHGERRDQASERMRMHMFSSNIAGIKHQSLSKHGLAQWSAGMCLCSCVDCCVAVLLRSASRNFMSRR